jgi:mannitol-specific phosphotransferase system IIBC component
VGYLEYESSKILDIPLGYIIGGVSGVGLFVIVTIIVCCCIYKRQKNKSKRDFEKMRYQLDNLESNVRNECKQGKRIYLLSYLFTISLPDEGYSRNTLCALN